MIPPSGPERPSSSVPSSSPSSPTRTRSISPVRRKPLLPVQHSNTTTNRNDNAAPDPVNLPRGLSPSPSLTPAPSSETPKPDPPPIPDQHPSLSPALFASSSSSLVDEEFLAVGPTDLDHVPPHRFPQRDPSARPLRLDTPSASATEEDDVDYGSQFSNGTPHSRLVSEPFIPVLPSPPIQPAMALHPPSNRPPPLRIDSAGARKVSASSLEPKTPGKKISSFFGWKAPVTSPGAESSSTEISDEGRSPLASSMPPSLPSASFSITPATTIPLDNSKPARNGSLSSASLLDNKLAELENELREISSELAGSIRREMELEDLVERLQSEMPLDTTNRRTSDYFSDSGTSSIRYANDSARGEDLEKFRRSAEQERAQLKIEFSQKWQEERSKRLATESHIQILENQVNQLRKERVEFSDLSSRNRELESTVEHTRRKLAEERETKDNFEDLLTAMRVEFEQLRNERDHLRDDVIPQINGGRSLPPSSSNPGEMERLLGEIEALKIENASLSQLQGTRFASIAEEDNGMNAGLGLSRSNSLARMHSKPNVGLSRSSSLSRPNSVSGKDRDPREALADRMDDVEMQRDALHQTLRNLLARQASQAREYEKRTRLMEMELAHAQQSGSPRKLGYERDVRNLREEVNDLRQRAEDALDQKWQCEKGLAGLKMDLDRAEQETASLRELLQEHDISVSGHSGAAAEGRDGFAEVLATSSSLECAYQQLLDDRKNAEASVAQSPVEEIGDLTASLNRTEALTTSVRLQLQSNSTLRRRLADAIGKGEKEQQLSATRINELQSQLKGLEDTLVMAQQLSEEEMGKHEDEIRQLQDNHSDNLQRMKNGARSPAGLSPRPPPSPFFGARSPRLDKTTTGDGVPLTEAIQAETLSKRVRELERLLRNADSEMEEVVGRMNRAQIDVGELQSDRDEALCQTRKLQAEILAERELFKALLSQ